ncbi:hypothetical protein [Parapedobacter pyrenivorans]|nr:hypothetical protein [Parapedobacter pyrenivorans]
MIGHIYDDRVGANDLKEEAPPPVTKYINNPIKRSQYQKSHAARQ